MNTKPLFAAALVAFASAGALAASPEYLTVAEMPTSTLTRAEVVAQFEQARAQGALRVGSHGDFTPVVHAMRPMGEVARSRDEVRSEAVAASKLRYDASTTFMQ